jgi:hypothetical protein
MSKPSDFMIGVLDFFAVLLPGAVATWLVTQYLPTDLRAAYHIESGEHASVLPWIVFLLTAYALGHFVFMAGSNLDPLYDRWRKRTKPIDDDVPFQAASALRSKVTPLLVGDGFSTFKWARSYVSVYEPQARIEIDRLEATSKFFRGMVVVSVLLMVYLLVVRLDVVLAAGALAACAMSFWRYCDQRWKMTELTYATAVIVHATKVKPKKGPGEKGEKENEGKEDDAEPEDE